MFHQLSKNANIASWIAQILAAAIFAMSAFFKLTSAPESVALFTTLGVEPWGRYLTGVVELVTIVLLLNHKTAAAGAALAIGIMIGAILAHLTKLGIDMGDGGATFIMALVVLAAATTVASLRKRDLPLTKG